MRILKLLFCAAFLFSVGVSAKTALTQEKFGDPFANPPKPKADDRPDPFQKDPVSFDDGEPGQPQPERESTGRGK